MEPKQIWNILGIEPVKEDEAIRNAYRNKLVTVNPEDDPEGFKLLRTAFEEALILAKQEEESPEEETPVSLWMKQVEDLYHSLSRRINPEDWKQILANDVCLDLETCQEAKEALLSYLMDHFRFPSPVWHVLDDEFSLCEEYQELYEKYPKNFINFVVNQCQTESWFDYTLFRGPDDGDYDTFLQKYHELRGKLEEDGKADITDDLKKIDELGIYHPYLEVERVHYLTAAERFDEALGIIAPISQACPNDTWILFTHAETLWKAGRKENSYELYKTLLDKEPEHYTAIVRMAEYCTAQEDYEKAKEYYIEAVRQNPNNKELSEGMEKVNEYLIDDYITQCEENKDDISLHLKLGWCMLQNHRYKEGIELLEGAVPDSDNQNEYHSLLGRLCFYNEQCDKAIQHVKSWIVLLKEEQKEQEDPDYKKEAKDPDSPDIRERLGAAYGLLTSVYRKMAELAPDQEKNIYYEKALEASVRSTDYDKSLEHLHQRAALLINTEKYKDSVDVCDEILKIDSGYLPAYLIRQECYYNLRNARQVIDDFYNAYEIYPYYPDMYKFAAKVFFAYDQYEDVMDILNKAKEHNVSSLELRLTELKTKRLMTNDHEEERLLGDEIKALEADYRKENRSHNEIGEVIYEEVLCLMDYKNYEEALHEIDRAIRENPSAAAYFWTKADIYFEMNQFETAIKIYLKCEESLPDSENLLEKTGRCYERLNQPLTAVEYYKKVLALNNEHPRANSRIVDVYDDMLSDKEDIKFLNTALPYADRQIELVPEAYYYIERGLMYMTAGIWDKALSDFISAIEKSPGNPYAYNNAGCVYKYTERFEEAVEMFEKAAGCMKEGETTLPYGNLGDCYERLGLYDKALEAYEKNLALFPNNSTIYRDIADTLREMGRYDEAVEYYRQAMELPNVRKAYYLMKIGDTCEEKGDLDMAVSYLTRSIKADAESGDALRSLGNLYRNHFKNYKKAEKCYKKALELEDDIDDSCIGLEKIYALMGKKKLARRYFDKTMDYLTSQYGSIDKYLATFAYLPARLYVLGNLYYYIGDYETAKHYYDKMITVDKCRKCTCKTCKEYLAGQARLHIVDKNYRQAANLLEQALKEDINLLEEKILLEDIKKKMKEMN